MGKNIDLGKYINQVSNEERKMSKENLVAWEEFNKEMEMSVMREPDKAKQTSLLLLLSKTIRSGVVV